MNKSTNPTEATVLNTGRDSDLRAHDDSTWSEREGLSRGLYRYSDTDPRLARTTPLGQSEDIFAGSRS
jgi:hypothetical protein